MPSHPSASRSTRTAATNRATATFTVPMTVDGLGLGERPRRFLGRAPAPAGGGAGASTRADMTPTVLRGCDSLRSAVEQTGNIPDALRRVVRSAAAAGSWPSTADSGVRRTGRSLCGTVAHPQVAGEPS